MSRFLLLGLGLTHGVCAQDTLLTCLVVEAPPSVEERRMSSTVVVGRAALLQNRSRTTAWPRHNRAAERMAPTLMISAHDGANWRLKFAVLK